MSIVDSAAIRLSFAPRDVSNCSASGALAAFSGAARPARGEADVGLCPSIDAACASASRAYELTRREEDVRRLLIEGSSMAAVAQKLVVSDNTVKSHVRQDGAFFGSIMFCLVLPQDSLSLLASSC
ncbi:helix-turn-helix transcriptional regulator, partial [Gordonibacter sp.]|uniref:helix-turn-helix transcriptional regulator n=1 Tax=Gordonibacter sp. TaxID=1968902 RepID=UPI002FC88BF6